jgi:hypothetical protein
VSCMVYILSPGLIWASCMVYILPWQFEWMNASLSRLKITWSLYFVSNGTPSCFHQYVSQKKLSVYDKPYTLYLNKIWKQCCLALIAIVCQYFIFLLPNDWH